MLGISAAKLHSQWLGQSCICDYSELIRSTFHAIESRLICNKNGMKRTHQLSIITLQAGTGAVSLEALQQFAKQGTSSLLSDVDLHRMFASFDQDKDRVISEKDFVSVYAKATSELSDKAFETMVSDLMQ
jgi:Ca2+-binding EF-hand superfamily protein